MSHPADLYGKTFDEVIDLDVLRAAHRPLYERPEIEQMDGNTVAAIASMQFWRSPIYAGFPITPSTKWLETIADFVAKGRFVVERDGRKVSTKRVKQLEAEHAVADYLVGGAAACRELVFQTATSSVGLDHMTETVRSLGASGLGNVMLINVYRATANYPLCIEGDPSDTLAHRDDGWIQVVCRGKQQIYDTVLQMPCVGMNPRVLIPTMPGFYGIKDSHRSEGVKVEPDLKVHEFQDSLIPRICPLPGLINGDTSMGNCVTSAHFQGFKIDQFDRLSRVLRTIDEVSRRFSEVFGRTGIEPLEAHFMDSRPRQVLVTMGPDAGTAYEVLRQVGARGATPLGLVVVRLLTPFPMARLRKLLEGVEQVGVVNNAFQSEAGHLTALVAQSLAGTGTQVVGMFAGIGGADVSVQTWQRAIELTWRGSPSRAYFLHEGEIAREVSHGDL
jgi:pyruvate ferredoxin oxidoreductase alpha subunit